ncbi:Biotin-protein ligase [Lunatimonas lonarensis]|uniref:Biotin-protein ligase n=2 Tax=Lunatimonas lonarensis TaxID=1232681 RepID=R7ZL33_9BACT|nr:Biotin-protein ligase [Lunatimonas lonarensis]
MVVCAENQTKGRGQRASRWFSEPGKNLTFSVVLRHKTMSASSLFPLSQAVSMGVFEVLREVSEQIFVKWPNDFVHQGMGKVGGMLIENSIVGQQVDYSVVGIGINVNQRDFPFPGATSLQLITGSQFDLGSLLERLLPSIERCCFLLINSETTVIRENYLRHLFRFREMAWFDDGVPFMGRIVDVEADGQLVIEKQNGERCRYSVKTIKFL